MLELNMRLVGVAEGSSGPAPGEDATADVARDAALLENLISGGEETPEVAGTPVVCLHKRALHIAWMVLAALALVVFVVGFGLGRRIGR